MVELFYILIGFLIGVFSYKYLVPTKNQVKDLLKITQVHQDHMRPDYYAYNGGFSHINKCKNCNLVGMYEDLHEANPCPRCGSSISRYGSGVFKEKNGFKMWVKNNLKQRQ